MRVLDEWPWGVAYGCDFVDRMRTTIEPGERCIDLQLDLEDMVPTGILVLHERTVRDMVIHLGWVLEDPHAPDKLTAAVELNRALRQENAALRSALATIAKKSSSVPEVSVTADELAAVS